MEQEFEKLIVNIKKLHHVLSEKDDKNVEISYKGNNYGVTKSWKISIGNEEFEATSHVEAAKGLYKHISSKVEQKIVHLRAQALAFESKLRETGYTNANN